MIGPKEIGRMVARRNGGRRGFRGLGGGGGGGAWTFSPAESAVMLPASAIWISQEGVIQSGTVSAWASYLGGLSGTLAQGTGAARPAYNASGGAGGLPLITFDGTDDVMKGAISAKGTSYSDAELGIVGQRVSYAAAGDFWIQYEETATSAKLFGLADSSATRWRVNSNVDLVSTTNPTGVAAHYSGAIVSGDYDLYKNGSLENTNAGAFTTQADGQTFAVGGRTTAAAYSNIAIQAVYVGAKLTADQRTYLRAALTHYTTINC